MPQPRRRQGSEQGPRRANGSGAKRGGGGGTFFLLLFALMACAGAAFVLFPDQVKELLGLQEPKPNEQEEVTDNKDNKDPIKKPVARKEPAQKETLKKPAQKETPKIKETPKEAPKPTFTQEADALSALDEVRDAYRKFEWTKARTLANKIKRMDATDETIAKAENIIDASRKLQNFMKDMDSDQYGMVRGIYTSGAVVQVTYSNGKSINVVPIKSMNDKTIMHASGRNPVDYVQNNLNSGAAYVMNAAGIPMELKSSMGVNVGPADMVSIKTENQQAFKEKWSKIKNNSILRNDPIALYEVARFCYEVGIDKPVTELLERALLLDPNLPESVQNDRASEYYHKMIRSIKADRRKTAAGHLRYLRNHFANTYIFKEAEAYYKGESDRIAKLQKEELEKQKRAKKQARQQAREEAQKKNDKKKLEQIAQIEKEEEAAEQEYVSDKGSSSTGAEAEADALHAEGMAYLEKAFEPGADRAGKKDPLLGKAFKKCMQAWQIYVELAEAGKLKNPQKMSDAKQDAYLAKKSMRP